MKIPAATQKTLPCVVTTNQPLSCPKSISPSSAVASGNAVGGESGCWWYRTADHLCRKEA